MNRLSLILLLVGMGLIVALTSIAADSKTKCNNREVFPSKIQSFVEENVPNGKIVKFEHDDHKIKVKCNDHTELYFNLDGECIKMENETKGLNKHLINHLPNAAVLYLDNNYNKVAVTEIEKKSYGYKVELRTSPNECEIWFNKDGSVKKEGDY